MHHAGLIDKFESLPHEKQAEVMDFVDFLLSRFGNVDGTQCHQSADEDGHKVMIGRDFMDFPVDHIGLWPEGFTLRREEMYGDDGR